MLFDIDAASASTIHSGPMAIQNHVNSNYTLTKRESKKENEKLLENGDEYFESAEQLRARLHSHLLTGRVGNSSLLAFA